MYFKFNGKSSAEFSTIVVEELPDIVVPAKKFNKIQIDGKDGNIYQETGYDDVTKTINFALKNNSELDAINVWLQGSGDLTLSNEAGKKYRATVLSSFSYQREGRFRRVAIDFTCEPYKYLENEADVVFQNDNPGAIDYIKWVGTYNFGGTVPCLPKLTIEGRRTYTLYIDLKPVFTISAQGSTTVVADSETEECFVNTVLSNHLMNGNFVKLAPGRHRFDYLGGPVYSITIESRSRFL